MAVKAHIDHETVLEAAERHGVVTRVVRLVRVVGLTDDDHQTLFSALTAAGVPSSGASLEGASNLTLVERNPKVVNKGTVDVTLVYEHARNNQALHTPHFGTLVYEIRASVSQVKSNTDNGGSPISLSHTYPLTDPDYPGETKTQGGEIEFFQPQTLMTVRGILTTNYPWLLERHIIGAVNESDWSGRGPREWLCVGFSWKPLDGVSGKHEVSIEFQHNPDTWDPTAIFIDDRTGKPPPNLIANVGYRTIEKLRAVNFESVIGSRVQGG